MAKANSGHFAYESLSFLLYPCVINMVAVILHFSYPIVVSSKRLFSQLVSYTFCASISLLHPIMEEGQKEGGNKASSSLIGSTELWNTIAKP